MPLIDPITMSTTISKGGAAPSASPKSVAPVPLRNSAAIAISAAHPLVLGALFVWRFGALVADPATTLQTALPVVAAIQVVFAVLCLPVAGSMGGKPIRKTRPGEKKKTDATGPNPLVTSVLSLLLAAIATPALYVLFILFGAPFLTHVSHTFLCCAHLAVLAVFPIFYVRGVDSSALQAVLGVSAPLDQTFGGFVGAFLGAWLGAIPIPLDWDREWQKWPVTIVAGVYLGYFVGAKLFGTVFYGKRWAAAVKEE